MKKRILSIFMVSLLIMSITVNTAYADSAATMSQAARWYYTMAGSDGPYPFGDAAGAVVYLTMFAFACGEEIGDEISKPKFISVYGKTLDSSNVKVKVKSNEKNKKKYYYSANCIPGDNVYIYNPITYSQAVSRLKQGKDVICVSKAHAYQVADGASGWNSPAHHSAHVKQKGKQYPHYHTNPKTGGHCFYF